MGSLDSGGFSKPFPAQAAAVAFAAGLTGFQVGLVAGDGLGVVDAQLGALGLTICILAHASSAVHALVSFWPSTPALVARLARVSNAADEFGAAVRVAGVVYGVHPQKYILSTQHFCPAQRNGEEYGVARWHVGNGDACGLFLGNINGAIGQGGAADGAQIEVYYLVLNGTQLARAALCCRQLGMGALAVVEAQGVAVVALAAGDSENGGGVEATGD